MVEGPTLIGQLMQLERNVALKYTCRRVWTSLSQGGLGSKGLTLNITLDSATLGSRDVEAD